MIVMDIQINNFFAFKNFHMNMSYPKKIVASYIQNEFLKGRPNFRYKKVNILTGANATGKTSFGRMLMRIFNFMVRKQFESITDVIHDSTKEASFSMDFITDDYILYRIVTFVSPKTEADYNNSDIYVQVKKTTIGIKDSYESCCKRFDRMEYKENSHFIEELEKITDLSWPFEYPAESLNEYKAPKENIDKYLYVLENTLKALDPSVEKVEMIEAVENTFVLRMGKKSVIMQDGKTIEPNILSSGTKAGIDVANFLMAIINGSHGFYYCDEKFSYIHSDIEKVFLGVMIHFLRDNDQLFFTTHNTDILDLPLPKHSFIFLKKDCHDEIEPIKCISASEYLKRNTDSLRHAVDNDLFSTAPNVERIYKIAELESYNT